MGKILKTLAGIALGASLLFGRNANAETGRVPAETDDLVQKILPSKKVEAYLNAEASQRGNTLLIALSGEKCRLNPLSLDIRLALPSSQEIEIQGIRQKAEMQTSLLDKTRKEVRLYPDKKFEKVSRKLNDLTEVLAEDGIGKIPVVNIIYSLVEKEKEWQKGQDEAELREKIKSLELVEIPNYVPPNSLKNPDTLRNCFSRTYEIELSQNPEKAYVVINASVLKDNGQAAKIKQLVLNFKGKPASKAPVPIIPGKNFPKSLESVLLSNPDLSLAEFYSPEELGKITETSLKNSYAVIYRCTQGDMCYEIYLTAIGQEEKNKIINIEKEENRDKMEPKFSYGTPLGLSPNLSFLKENKWHKNYSLELDSGGNIILVLHNQNYFVKYLFLVPRESVIKSEQKIKTPKGLLEIDNFAANFYARFKEVKNLHEEKMILSRNDWHEYGDIVFRGIDALKKRQGQ